MTIVDLGNRSPQPVTGKWRWRCRRLQGVSGSDLERPSNKREAIGGTTRIFRTPSQSPFRQRPLGLAVIGWSVKRMVGRASGAPPHLSSGCNSWRSAVVTGLAGDDMEVRQTLVHLCGRGLSSAPTSHCSHQWFLPGGTARPARGRVPPSAAALHCPAVGARAGRRSCLDGPSAFSGSRLLHCPHQVHDTGLTTNAPAPRTRYINRPFFTAALFIINVNDDVCFYRDYSFKIYYNCKRTRLCPCSNMGY